MIWLMIGLILGALIPEARVLDGMTDKIYDSNTGEFSEEFQESKPVLTSNENLLSFIGYIVLVWDMISLMIDILIMPIGLIVYLKAIEAPAMAILITATIYIGLLTAIISDYISGR